MSERALRLAVAALALCGAAITGYLLSAHWTGAGLICTTGGCESVQSSSYAEVLRVPVPLVGLVGFLLIGGTSLATTAAARITGAALALAAVTFSAYLLVIQLAVIEAVCDWCLAGDAVASLLAVTALLRLRRVLAPQAFAGAKTQ